MAEDTSCDCFDSSAIKADVTKLELGPAYYDYKAGKRIPFEWKPNIDLVTDGWIYECCATGDVDYMLGNDSKLHYAMLALWCVISLILFAYFFRHREEQPFKFRDWRVVSLMYLNMGFMMFCYTFNYTMDRTASTTSNLFVTFVALPTQVGYYILKSFQLLYIYKWNEMKNTHKDLQTLQLFKKYQFVLTTKFFVIGFFTFVAVGCGLAVAQMQLPVYKDAVSDQFTATTRCYFWQFDEKYQTPTIPYHNMCDCFFNTVYKLPEYSDGCFSAGIQLALKCELGTATPTEFEMCAACVVGTDQECLDWFTEYFVSGACGQLPQVPKTSTCTYAIPASRTTMYTAGGYISLLLLINLLLILPISYKIDQFGMIFENMLVFAGLGTCLGIYNAGLLILDFYESWDDLSPDYSLTFLLFWVENWWCMVTTLGCSAIHYLWSRYRRQRRHFVAKRRKSLENGAAVMMKIFKREDNWSAMSAVDELDAEIEFWLKHKPVREYYKQFALEEFTAENPAFLEECYEYLVEVWEALKHPTLSLMLTLMAQGQKLSDKYVANGSPMEVNLSSRTKKKVQEALDDSMVHFDGGKINVIEGDTNNTYQPVTSEREDSRIYSQNSNYESQGPESESERADDMDVTESTSEPTGTPGTPRGSTPRTKRDSESRKKGSKRKIFSRRSEKSSTSSNLSEEDFRAQTKIKQLEDAFLQALNDIRDLVTRDSWPRFRDSRHYVQFQMLYENENRLNAKIDTVTSARFDTTPRPTNDADGEPRESFFQRVRSFSARRSLSESRPASFVVVNHTPQLGTDPNASPATEGSRKGSAGEAIAAKFMGSGSGSFRVSRVPSVQEENAASLDIGDSSL